MHHLTRLWDYMLNVKQDSQPENIDSEDVVVRNQETQMSNEAPSTSSSFYLVSEGTMNISSMPSKNESKPEPEMSSLSRQLDELRLVDLPRSRTTGYPDNFRKNLEMELGRLRTREAKMIRRIDGRKQELETLKIRDEEEKWEDNLFVTRMKELEAANAIIETRSSASKEDIISRVNEINEQIVHISAVVVGVRLNRLHVPSFSDAITQIFGHRFLSLFQKSGYYPEKQTIKALLQMYLARSCVTIICSWNPEKYLNSCLDQLYNLIAVNESQAVAGKWRQMAFKQLPHGPDQEALQQFTIKIVDVVSTIASYAGWGGGDISEIKALVQELVVNARIVQEYAKTGFISADVQAWIVHPGDMYDPATMEGALNESGMGSRVLGSTGIGLRVCYTSRDGSAALQMLLPSKVFCIRG